MRLPTRWKSWVIIAQFLICATLVVGAQAQQPAPANPSTLAESKTVTVKGCMTGYGDRYSIGTARDDLYVLQGDISLFKRYSGKMVQATGTLTPAVNGASKHDALSQQPPELLVTKLKKVGDVCGN